MSLFVGLLLFLLGAFAFWAWLPYTLYFLKGLIACLLLLSGVLTMVVGLAASKGKKQLKEASSDEASQFESGTPL